MYEKRQKRFFILWKTIISQNSARSRAKNSQTHVHVFFFIYNCVGNKNLVARDLFVYVRSTKLLLYLLHL